MKITTLPQFEAFLKTRIPSREALFMGSIGLDRSKHFLKLLGNPQNKIKVIHIAGTSGKGSTACLTSHILQSQGLSVGLSISPHIFDIRERMQINNKLPDKKLILKYFNEILPAIKKMEKSKYGSPTFFEINVGLAFHMFAKEKLDYAVMETGLGGLLDATNTVTSKNKIAILTKIGLDHTEILGKTVSKITADKSAIIQKQNMAISISQTGSARNIIQKRCEEKNAKLFFVSKKNHKVISSTPIETVFDFNFNGLDLKNINLGLIGQHQAENCSLALACLATIAQRDKFSIDEKLLRSMLRNIKIPGRMEIRKIKGQTLVIDGAHNPQKMQTFVRNLSVIYPKQKFIFIVAFKKSKEYKKILKEILPVADKILLTSFSTSGMDNHWSSVDNNLIAEFLRSQNFKNFKIIDNNHSIILENIRESKKPVVITGSLYLIGSMYKFLN